MKGGDRPKRSIPRRDIIAAPMIECPYCYNPVKPQDNVCPRCGKAIARWQTGFYTRQALPPKARTAVWIGSVLIFLLLVFGFARSCHWI